MFDVYKTIFIAKFETEIHISFIDIHLNKLQIKANQRLQDIEHYEKIKKIKTKIHRTFKSKKKTKN